MSGTVSQVVTLQAKDVALYSDGVAWRKPASGRRVAGVTEFVTSAAHASVRNSGGSEVATGISGGLTAFLVGGCVRDRMLGVPGRDRDWVVVGATPEDMALLGFQRVGKGFPVFLHPETAEEYALARTGGGERAEFHPAAALEDDLRRRDFTINAMAMDADGRLIDPTGGAADLGAKVIRHIGESLADDPVRILRAARLAARLDGFSIAPETQAEMARLVAAGALATSTPERLWLELDKALATPRPSRFFVALHRVGVLAAVLPELDALFGVPQRAKFHPEIDTGLHTMMVVDRAAVLTDDTAVRFAALVHDLGKGVTPRQDWPRHSGHETRGADLVHPLVRRLGGPNHWAELGQLAATWHGLIPKIAELRPGTVLEVLSAADAFHRPERLEALLIVAETDRRGRLGREEEAFPEASCWRQALAAANTVTARDLVASGHQPGPGLGAVLFQRRAEAIRIALSR